MLVNRGGWAWQRWPGDSRHGRSWKDIRLSAAVRMVHAGANWECVRDVIEQVSHVGITTVARRLFTGALIGSFDTGVVTSNFGFWSAVRD